MLKKISYVCQECGASYSKWQGKCLSCNAWNSIIEEVSSKNLGLPKNINLPDSHNAPLHIDDIVYESHDRIVSNDNEFNRVLGGGIVLGSLILLGGEPGIGKSTLLLQVVCGLAGKTVLYVSGEESASQIKMRANRINKSFNNCYIYAENCLENIFKQANKIKPDIIVIDSIQTIYSVEIEPAIGSVAQVKACTMVLMEYAKKSNVSIFIVGHITKEGALAGPKVLEHMVDVVLQFEGDANMSYRLVRTIKNRFGASSELGIYEMYGDGLRVINNPSEMFLSYRSNSAAGAAIGTCMEGNRCILIEVQSLLSKATYSSPQRSTTGFEIKRLHMLLAVLEKIVKLKLIMQDVFLNIVGGLKVTDTALDLPVCVAIISSFYNKPVLQNRCFIGEIGLSGELRYVSNVDKRIMEASKLGFKDIYIPMQNYKKKELINKNFDININPLNNLEELLSSLS